MLEDLEPLSLTLHKSGLLSSARQAERLEKGLEQTERDLFKAREERDWNVHEHALSNNQVICLKSELAEAQEQELRTKGWLRKLEKAEADLADARKALRTVQGMCGNPDASAACRIIVKFVNDELARQAEEDE